MPKHSKTKLQVYTEKKAEGLERIRQSAQFAFIKAQEEKNSGNVDEAVRWMDRAHRLAEHNPNITFDLVMLRLKQGYYDEAYQLLSPLMKKFDFYEGWLVLAILFTHKNEIAHSLEQLQHALSRFCPTSKTWGMIRDIVRKAQEDGCCGLIGSLGQVWVDNRKRKPISVYLDNELISETTEPFFSLPIGWEENAYLSLEIDGKPLIGSPIDIQAIIRTEGFVEANDKFLQGWLWHPAEPDRIPTIYIYNQQGNLQRQVQAIKEFEVATLDFPLFRAKQFFVSLKEFDRGLYHVKDFVGRNLIGSPIEPLLFQQPQKKCRNIEKKHENYIPVSAYYKGVKPAISEYLGMGIVVIIPVYKGKQETIACVQSVLKNSPKEVIVQLVNDCSPDVELIEWLETKVNHENVFLIHHLENLGFPGAVNTGMKAWIGYDVILLNSDTLVAKGWYESLLNAAYSAEDIGTVTPFSNDASIFSYPYHDKENPEASLQSVQNLMRYMQKTHQNITIDVPTAHGFCMFIRHDCLVQTGFFRENLFAQGYGEENDFCMRAQHLGWRHVLAADCFVGHKGGVSFQNNKQSLLKRNLAILNKLYPDYDQMVMEYIDQDFLRVIRRKVDLYRLQELEKKHKKSGKSLQYELFITHTYGGGVERAVQERANDVRLKGIIPLFIRPTLLGNACRLEIQFRSPSFIITNIEDLYPNLIFDLPSEYTDLLAFLKCRFIPHMQVHHFAGHHTIIHNLLQDTGIDYDVHIHDYMSFCPRISLINKKDKYCKEPKSLNKCQQCIGDNQFDEQEKIQMQKWIERSQNELIKANTIIAPSEDTANRIYRHFPEVKTIQINYLEDDRENLSIEQLSYFSHLAKDVSKEKHRINSDRFRVCIIGAIGIEKGFHVVQKLVEDADARDLPIEFIVVGRTVDDRLFVNTNRLFITGTYQEEEAISLVMQQDADLAFFPAIWPETWCYALSIAWRSGLQTVAFDIGAIAQRIKKTKRGWVLSPLMTVPEQNDMLLDLCWKLRHKKDN